MDKRGKIFIFLIILLVTAVLTWGVSFLENYRPSTVLSGRPLSSVSITDFESCAAAGYPVMESYPEQCRTPDGQTFTRDIGNELEKSNLIKVFKPRPSEEVISPLQITGEARGYWYFEASFPVELRDANGNVLVSYYATAEDEWMTEEFVPFKTTLEFAEPTTAAGVLILRKDNPSGLPEHDDALIVPVRFAPSGQASPVGNNGACRPTGCSGQVCSDEDVITTCEFRAVYACYKKPFTVCERQSSGKCGWTETDELKRCLEDKRSGPEQVPDVPSPPMF